MLRGGSSNYFPDEETIQRLNSILASIKLLLVQVYFSKDHLKISRCHVSFNHYSGRQGGKRRKGLQITLCVLF